jgi:hypothetical protein
MPNLTSFVHLQGVLSESDVVFFKSCCKRQLKEEGIPCYGLLEELDNPVVQKVKALVEKAVQEKVNYINDFYLYSDTVHRSDWHVDTELFTFERAVNAWILLSPDEIESPLALLPNINEGEGDFYHTIKKERANCILGILTTGESLKIPRREIENNKLSAPNLSIGDILLFNPGQFHKTNTPSNKHSHIIKFLFGSKFNCLSENQVESFYWPEVSIFTDLVKGKSNWDEVLQGLKVSLKNEKERANLCAGFFPDNFPKYIEKSHEL